jgi:hypothetical protein
MDLKKIVLATGLLAAIGAAGVLDTNDVKLSTTLGLGGNPAAIAVNKKSKIEAGSIVVNNTQQSNQVLNADQGVISLYDGRNINSSSFDDASKFLGYTDAIGDNWFSVRYSYDSNLYPNFHTKTGLPIPVPEGAKMTRYRKDATEKIGFTWAREWQKGFSAGVELATNIYTLDDKTNFNKLAEGLITQFKDNTAYSQSGSYYTLTIGGIYDIFENQKISLSQKFSQDRGVYKNDGKGLQQSWIESLPNETGLAYIIQANQDWEVAAVYKAFWGTVYEKNIRSSDSPLATEIVNVLPCNSYGFATSYRIGDWELQGYGNFLRNYRASITSGGGTDEKGYNVSQVGGNIQYSPEFLSGGTILLGSYVNRLVNEDAAVGTVFDITNTTLSYSHTF